MEDKQIIIMLKNQPVEGLHAAIEKYGGSLEKIVSRILYESKSDIEECVADTFIAAWRTIDRLDKNSNLGGYLLCIARNNAINRYHQKKRQKHLSLDKIVLVSDNDPLLAVLEDETMKELQQEILNLAQPDQEIIIRKYFLFESIKQISHQLNLDEIQVKNRLYRTRKKMQNSLIERGITLNAI